MGKLGLIVFWALYSASFCMFKRGSMPNVRWLPNFIIGNIFGITGTAVLMLLYKIMNVNAALGLALGGGFVIAQFTLSIIYKNKLEKMQYLGALAVAIGVFMLAAGGKQ